MVVADAGRTQKSYRLKRSRILSGQPAIGFVNVDLTARELFQHVKSWIGGRLLAEPELGEHRIETRARRRITDAKVPLEIFHVSARGKENAQDVPVVGPE